MRERERQENLHISSLLRGVCVIGKFAFLSQELSLRLGLYQVFWIVAQSVLVVVYRRFGTAMRSRNVDKLIEERTYLFRLA